MWSLGLLAYSWLFLQTIGSAHFSRGMSSDRPMEMSAPMFQSFNEIRIRLNASWPAYRISRGGRGSVGSDANIASKAFWEMSDTNTNQLLHPRYGELRAHEKNMVTGVLVVVRSAPPGVSPASTGAAEALRRPLSEGADDGCGPILNPGRRQWIALVADGGSCTTDKKVSNLFENSNASGVIVYGLEGDSQAKDMRNQVPGVSASASAAAAAAAAGFGSGGKSGKRGTSRSRQLAVWVKYDILKEVLARCNVSFPCNATLMVTVHPNDGLINRTSVLFVSISFILLMIISLAWLVFYYVQRFRYIHAKERLSRRLANAAKKALTKIPVKTLLRGDQETENEYDQCAVCIEQYKPSDTIRILPCRHYFHKSCIDPWLLEQRSCPMCKLDILKAYGLQVRGFSEGPSDTLAEHSDINGLGGRTTSVSLDGAGREAAVVVAGAGDAAPDTAASDADAATVRLVSDEARSNASSAGAGSGSTSGGCSAAGGSPGASSGAAGVGGRVTIEPPEVQYHLPQRVSPAPASGAGPEAAGGATVEVRVEQHVPRTGTDDEEEEDEEDEEAAASRPLVSGSGAATNGNGGSAAAAAGGVAANGVADGSGGGQTEGGTKGVSEC